MKIKNLIILGFFIFIKINISLSQCEYCNMIYGLTAYDDLKRIEIKNNLYFSDISKNEQFKIVSSIKKFKNDSIVRIEKNDTMCYYFDSKGLLKSIKEYRSKNDLYIEYNKINDTTIVKFISNNINTSLYKIYNKNDTFMFEEIKLKKEKNIIDKIFIACIINENDYFKSLLILKSINKNKNFIFKFYLPNDQHIITKKIRIN